MLCGILAVVPTVEGLKRAKTLRLERLFLGSVLGSLESWLGVRSLRTLELRVQRQSESATRLVAWLDSALHSSSPSAESTIVKKVISKITHASLQATTAAASSWLPEQMPNGYGPVFSIYTHTNAQARSLPSFLHLFHHATSLGGVESLIEWRRMSDTEVDESLLRVSVGVENWEDLKDDLLKAFEELGRDGKNGVESQQVDAQTGEKGAKVESAAGGAV